MSSAVARLPTSAVAAKSAMVRHGRTPMSADPSAASPSSGPLGVREGQTSIVSRWRRHESTSHRPPEASGST